MTHTLKHYSIILIIGFSFTHTHAATLTLSSESDLSAVTGPVTVTVNLNPEGSVIGGVGGVFSFPTNAFTVGEISTDNSIISMWVTQPQVTKERSFDLRTRIQFEGVIPGGFSGVRSSGYEGVRSGSVIKVTLIPKEKVTATFLLDTIALHTFTETGRTLPAQVSVLPFSVVKGSLGGSTAKELSFVKNTTAEVLFTRNELVENNSWFVTVIDESSKAIQSIEIAETGDYRAPERKSFLWRRITGPYVLRYQSRDVYVHVKITYYDTTYTIKTTEPVEKSQGEKYLSRILLSTLSLVIFIFCYAQFQQWFSARLCNKK